MVLDLKLLKKSGKEREDFFFSYQPQDKLIGIDNVDIVLPVGVSGSITLTGDHSAYVEGEISFSCKGDCTRCLKETENKYLFTFSEEVEPDNKEGYSVVNDKVYLSKIVDDTVMIDFPQTFLCKEDCKGICVNCGVNLNDEDCKCEK